MHSIGNSKSIYQKMSIKLVHLRPCMCQCRGMEHTYSRVKLTVYYQPAAGGCSVCGDWSCPVWRQPGYKLLNISDL